MRSHAKALIAVAALTLLALLGVATATADTAPSVAIEAPSEVKYTSAHLKGTVNPNGGPSQTCWRFEYRQKEEEGENWQSTNFDCLSEEDSAKSEALSVFVDFNGFAPNTAYLVRLTASNEGGENSSSTEELETKEVTPPSVSIEAASSISGTTALFKGKVDPGNADEAFNSSCRFEYVSDAKFKASGEEGGFAQAQSVDCDVNPVTGAGETEVQAEATNLEPHTTYHLRIRAENLGGANSAEAPSFQTLALAPLVGSTFVSGVTSSEATLSANINPRGAETTYRFQYVSEAQFKAPEEGGFAKAALTPSTPLGATDNTLHLASSTISGLQPATSYRYRALATNSIGSSEGEVRALHTFALPNEAPDACPNAALRAAQHSAYLADCRAYEMVSPPSKNGADVTADSARTRAAINGDAVSYMSLTGFGDVRGTGIAVEYIAKRGNSAAPGDNGWHTHGITPPQEPMTLFADFKGIEPRYLGDFGDDLTKGVFQAWSPLTDEPKVDTRYMDNLYVRDDLLTPGPGSYRLVTDSVSQQPVPSVNGIADAQPVLAGASADFSQIIFESPLNLVEGATGNSTKLYLWDEGQVSLAGVLPGGKPALCASSGKICSLAGRGAGRYSQLERAISRDGRRVTFSAPTGEGTVFQRIDGSETIRIDASERTDCAGDPSCGGDGEPDPAPESSQPAEFWWASADGTRVFFTTAEQLTDDDGDGVRDLYLYDADKPKGERLTLVSADEYPLDADEGVEGVIGASADGDYVYFIYRGLLAAGPPLEGEGTAIYLWHDGDIRLVAPMFDFSADYGIDMPGLFALAGGRYEARVTPDGRHLLFTSHSGQGILSLRGGVDYDHGPSDSQQKYVYDADTDELQCASCDPSGAIATGATAAVREGTGAAATTSHVNRSLSDDGRYAFFETAAALLPQRDTNGRIDAYAYDTQTETLSLLSTGTSDTDSYFLDASGNGKDAFIVTRQALVGWDFDNNYDLYDVRVGGGFPEPLPTTAPCGGENCRTSGANPPSAIPPATAGFSGPGDPTRPKPCPKGKRRVKARGGKSRCVKPKKSKSKHNRTAKNDRRASR